MDQATLAVLTSDIESQMDLIDDVFSRLEDRAAGLDSNDEKQLESVAYQLHNLYNAVEDLFKLVAGHFENRITDASQWHVELLRRMKQDIAGVRPALLSDASYRILNSLRSFRHFFRHAYAAPIEYEQLRINLDKAHQLRPHLEQDVAHFLDQLRPSVEQ